MVERYEVSVPQLCIHCTLQLGTVSLPKTANLGHLRSNVQVDVTISDDNVTCQVSATARRCGRPT